MPFGLHWIELIPLVLIALLIFGPKKLPEMGSAIGKTIKEFQKSMREAKDDQVAAASDPKQIAASSTSTASETKAE